MTILVFIQKHYISIILILVLAYLVYIFFDMIAEKSEPNETNATGTDYAPVPYNSVSYENFNISELKCKDGSNVPAQYTGNANRLLANLQILRNYIGLPIIINSGYRTPTHNRKIGGATSSAHLRAMAADIIVLGMQPKEVRSKIQELIAAGKMQDGGIGSYKTFTHYDISKPRRWKQ